MRRAEQRRAPRRRRLASTTSMPSGSSVSADEHAHRGVVVHDEDAAASSRTPRAHAAALRARSTARARCARARTRRTAPPPARTAGSASAVAPVLLDLARERREPLRAEVRRARLERVRGVAERRAASSRRRGLRAGRSELRAARLPRKVATTRATTTAPPRAGFTARSSVERARIDRRRRPPAPRRCEFAPAPPGCRSSGPSRATSVAA